jgi:hypothetical protein
VPARQGVLHAWTACTPSLVSIAAWFAHPLGGDEPVHARYGTLLTGHPFLGSVLKRPQASTHCSRRVLLQMLLRCTIGCSSWRTAWLRRASSWWPQTRAAQRCSIALSVLRQRQAASGSRWGPGKAACRCTLCCPFQARGPSNAPLCCHPTARRPWSHDAHPVPNAGPAARHVQRASLGRQGVTVCVCGAQFQVAEKDSDVTLRAFQVALAAKTQDVAHRCRQLEVYAAQRASLNHTIFALRMQLSRLNCLAAAPQADQGEGEQQQQQQQQQQAGGGSIAGGKSQAQVCAGTGLDLLAACHAHNLCSWGRIKSCRN